MRGAVDSRRRPLLNILLRDPLGQERLEAPGFSGMLTVPQQVGIRLGLPLSGPTLLLDASGRLTFADSYTAEVEWVARFVRCPAVENQIPYCLIGSGLLDGRVLTIDYALPKTVEVR